MKHRIIALCLVLLMTISLLPQVSAGAPESLWEYEQAEGGIRLTKYRCQICRSQFVGKLAQCLIDGLSGIDWNNVRGQIAGAGFAQLH